MVDGWANTFNATFSKIQAIGYVNLQYAFFLS